MQNQRIEISSIIVDEKIQQREQLNEEYIVEISKEIADGTVLPPLDVYNIDGDLRLADGFHRLKALIENGEHTVEINIFEGTERDAILHAIRVNAKHGLRFTNADKRKAVTTLLKEWGSLSDGQIAEICCVSQPFVSKISNELTHNGFERDSQRLGKDGRLTETANIGASPQTEEPEESSTAEASWSLLSLEEMIRTDENEELHSSEENDDDSSPDADSEDAADVASTNNNDDDGHSDSDVDETNSSDNEEFSTEAESSPDSGTDNASKADDESSDQTEEGNSGSDGNHVDEADESTSTASDEEELTPASSSEEQAAQKEGEEPETDSSADPSPADATDEDDSPVESGADDSQASSVDLSESGEVQTQKARIAELENTIVEKDQRIEELEAENAELQEWIQELEKQLLTSDDFGEPTEELSNSAIC